MENNIKFSIIVPVYNVEKYIKKCIDSILNQTYKNYEIIIINDGSTDNSSKIINNYKKNKKIKIITQKNKGLSAARNKGIKLATGDYILFIDSDDYIDENLLLILNKKITNEDLIRFQLCKVDENNNIIKEYPEQEFTKLNGVEAFNRIVNYNYIELAVCYCYKREIFIKHNYLFKENTYHEDFGLIPIIIINSNKVSSINYIGYNYLQRKNSIMNKDNYNKELKKTYDVLEHYKFLKEESKILKKDSPVFNSYIANSLILKIVDLKKVDYKLLKKELKKLDVYKNLLNNTFNRKTKKLLLKISPKLYYKIIRGIK